MSQKAYKDFALELEKLKTSGLYKDERVIASAQGPVIEVAGRKVLNFCANNYLGLANHPEILAAAHQGLDRHGYGLASVRFSAAQKHSCIWQVRRFFGLPALESPRAHSSTNCVILI